MALIGEVPKGTLSGKTCEWNSDFGVSIDKMMVEVGNTEEGLNVLDFPGFWPMDDLDFVWGNGEAFAFSV